MGMEEPKSSGLADTSTRSPLLIRCFNSSLLSFPALIRDRQAFTGVAYSAGVL